MYDPGGLFQLRPMDDKDVDLMVYLLNTPSIRTYIHPSMPIDGVFTPDSFYDYLHKSTKHRILHVIESKQPTYPVGFTVLYVDIDDASAQYVPVCLSKDIVLVDYDHKRQAAEYVVISYAFDTLRLRYIWLVTTQDNSYMHTESGFVIAAAGFQQDGTQTLKCTFDAWHTRRSSIVDKYSFTHLMGV